MDPYEKFCWCNRVVLRKMFQNIFLDVFADEFRFTRGYFAVMTVFILGTLSCIYTIATYDALTGLLCIANVMGVLEGAVKYSFIKDLRIMIKVASFLEEIYKKQTKSPVLAANYQIAVAYANKSSIIVRLGVVSSFACASVYMFYPLVVGWITQNYFPQLRIYAPGIDEGTTSGFLILSLFNCAIIICAIFAIYPIDILTINIFVNIPMVSDFVVSHLQAFRKDLTDGKLNLEETKIRLLIFIRMHTKYNDAIMLLRQGFYRMCLCQMIMAPIHIIIGIHYTMTASLGSPFMMACIAFTQIACFCVLGTIIETSRNEVYEAVKSFDWNYLTIADAKLYEMMVQHTQQPQIILIGGSYKLNMQTFLSIMRTIYSYIMILRSVML